MDNNPVSPLSQLAAAPNQGTARRGDNEDQRASWFEALARAWGDTLDSQATRIADLANQIGPNGNDNPSVITQLTAESLRFSYLSQSQSTSVTSIGEALRTTARKQ